MSAKSLSSFKTFGLLVAALLILGLLLLSAAGYLFAWPEMDEANYLLQARNISQGMLPYRDFYEFITPGGQLLGALWSRFYGFSVLSLRLWVFTGWLVELLLIYDMGKKQLSKTWLSLLLFFIALTDMRNPVYQHHFFSGFFALCAVYCTWKYIQGWYKQGQKRKVFLVASGIFTGFTFWVTQSLGGLLTLAFVAYGLLHCFLHEREEKNLMYQEVSNTEVLKRWGREWGTTWALPLLLVHAVALAGLASAGLWNDFWRDTTGWLLEGHYSKTTSFGYYVTFHTDVARLLKPILEGHISLFWFRIPQLFQLLAIGIFPIAGLLGVGYQLPQRFLYRLLRLEDEELLLWWIAALALILSTMTYSTSMHIVSNGALAFLLGGWTIQNWIKRSQMSQKREHFLLGTGIAGCVLFLIGSAIGSYIILLYGMWMPAFPALQERLVYINQSPSAEQYLKTVKYLQQAVLRKQPVFIYNHTPSLYLAGTFQNATRYTIILPHYTSPGQIDEILKDLNTHPPLYILYDQADRLLGGDPRFSQYAPNTFRIPQLEAYIQANYVPKVQEGLWIIFERKTNGLACAKITKRLGK